MSAPPKKAIVIGAGFAGLSAACFMAKAGLEVTVLEKNDSPGGRARAFSAKGFTWDMGPSWYWMPDVFESFFAGSSAKRCPTITTSSKSLDPSYQVFWEDAAVDIPAGF